MSSSDPPFSPRSFVVAFCGSVIGCAIVFVLLMLVIDPIGAGDGNPVCEQGAKSRESVYVKPLLPDIRHPRTVVMGTSRVHYGFDSAALASVAVTGPATNLGLAGALPADWRKLGMDVLRNADGPVIYLGVDFSSAYQSDTSQFDQTDESVIEQAFAHLRGSWFSDQALRVLPGALFGCAVLIRPDGSPVLDSSANPLHNDQLQTPERLVRAIRMGQPQRWMDERSTQISDVLRQWHDEGATVIVFSAPYRSELLEIYRQEGMLDDFITFHRRLREISANQGAAYLDFNAPATFAELNLPACPEGGTGCHYFDLTHYRPELARAMAPRMRQAALAAVPARQN